MKFNFTANGDCMTFKKICLFVLLAALPLIFFTSCAPVAAVDLFEEAAYEIYEYEIQEPLTEDIDIDTGVTLEILSISDSEVLLLITNNTDDVITYSNGYDFSHMMDSRLSGMGAWYIGSEQIRLPGGHSFEIRFGDGVHFWPGEFRLTKTITISGEEHELYVEFLIEDNEIAPDIDDFIMEITMADPQGAVIMLTNGSADTRMYFDRHYSLLKNIDGVWQCVPELTTRFFPDDEHFVSRRQTRRVVKNWGWLHGEIEDGQYRIEKSFWHYTEYGERIERDMYVEFEVDGVPRPHPYIWGYNPFEGADTFRAEVYEDVNSLLEWRGRLGPSLLIYTITPLWGAENPRRPIREPMYIVDNDFLAVLDINGEPMLFEHIPQGAVVDITFSGVILTSRPGILGGAILIQMVEAQPTP
ncbi:MAG: hypothetical protein FWE24_10710 [Defluviitaleaceae bacterium]|nr:hypothetical protein [Defluviitaleaceae bacterium]